MSICSKESHEPLTNMALLYCEFSLYVHERFIAILMGGTEPLPSCEKLPLKYPPLPIYFTIYYRTVDNV